VHGNLLGRSNAADQASRHAAGHLIVRPSATARSRRRCRRAQPAPRCSQATRSVGAIPLTRRW
jgi:hypothetical protein